MYKVQYIDQIIYDSDELWLSGLFGELVGWNSGHDILAYKEMFFEILQDLLEQGSVRFCSPDDPLGRKQPYWQEEHKKIIGYLMSHWSAGIIDEDDERLNAYFYYMPAISWRCEDGNYRGS